MQGAVGSGAAVANEELTILQLAEGSPVDKSAAPVSCGDSRRFPCVSDGQQTTVEESPPQITDMKYIILSSTPFHKVSSPIVPTLVSDTSADWSVSMATPTNLQRTAKRETPLVTTTDEETSDIERTVTKRRLRALPARSQNVIRTLFTPQCVDPLHSTATRTTHPTPLPFSPISASPLHSVQRHGSPEAPPTNTSVSLISTHTVAETPARPDGRGRRSERESVGLNRGFCVEEAPMSSQELFHSPDVFEDVKTVPDSPLGMVGVARVPESPARPEEQTPGGNLSENVTQMDSAQINPNETQVYDQTTAQVYPMQVECAHQNISRPPSDSAVRREAQLNPSLNSNSRGTNNFVYPRGRRRGSRRQSRGKRKRDEASSVEPPGKRASSCCLGAEEKPEVAEIADDGVMDTAAIESVAEIADDGVMDTAAIESVAEIAGDGVMDTAAIESVAESDCEMRPGEDEIDEKQDGKEEEEEEKEEKTSAPELPLESVGESDCEMRPGGEEEDNETGEDAEEGKVEDSKAMVESDNQTLDNKQQVEAKVSKPVPQVAVSLRSMRGTRAPGLLHKTLSSCTRRDRPRDTQPPTTPSVCEDPANPPPPPSFVGFQTASGRSLSLSEVSLQKAQRLLSEDMQELDSGPLPKPPITSHQQQTPVNASTSRRPASAGVLRSRTKPFKPPRPAGSVSVAEEKARVARLLRGMKTAGAEVGAGQTPTSYHVECGFSTGSGRKLSVSSTALHKAQQLVATDKENGLTPSAIVTPTPNRMGSESMAPCGSQSAMNPCGSASAGTSSIAPIGSGLVGTSSIAPIGSGLAGTSSIAPIGSGLAGTSSIAPIGSGLAGTSSIAPIGSGLAGTSSIAPIGSGLVGTSSIAPIGSGLAGTSSIAPIGSGLAGTSSIAPIGSGLAGTSSIAPIGSGLAGTSSIAPIGSGLAGTSSIAPIGSGLAGTSSIAPIGSGLAGKSSIAPIGSGLAGTSSIAPIGSGLAGTSSIAPIGSGLAGTSSIAPIGSGLAGTSSIAPIGSGLAGTSSIAPIGSGLAGTSSIAPIGSGLAGTSSIAPIGSGLVGTSSIAPIGSGLAGTSSIAPIGSGLAGTSSIAPIGSGLAGTSSIAPIGSGLAGTSSIAPIGSGLAGTSSIAPIGSGLVGTSSIAPIGSGLAGTSSIAPIGSGLAGTSSIAPIGSGLAGTSSIAPIGSGLAGTSSIAPIGSGLAGTSSIAPIGSGLAGTSSIAPIGSGLAGKSSIAPIGSGLAGSMPPLCCGFTSASGRALSLSAKAVEKARSLLSDIDSSGMVSAATAPPAAVTPQHITKNRPSASDSRAATEEESDNVYTRGFGKEDLIDFAVFTQFNLGPEEEEDGGKEGSGRSQGPGIEVRSGDEGDTVDEGDAVDENCTAYFSTQAVRQFLNFSEDSEQEEEELSPQHVMGEGENLSKKEENEEGNEKEEEEGSRTASQTLMDELFGVVSPEGGVVGQSPWCRTVGEEEMACTDGVGDTASVGSTVDGELSLCVTAECPMAMEQQSQEHDMTLHVDKKPVVSPNSQKERDDNSSSPVKKGLFPGLMTASGREVVVSSSALSAAKELLNTGPLSVNESLVKKSLPPSFPGLMTASGREVVVSSSALSAAKELLNTGPLSVNESLVKNSVPPSFPGLMTASGREVVVSSSALSAAKERLNTGPGTSQPSGDREESLGKGEEGEDTRGAGEKSCLEDPSLPRLGFMTASGRTVEISEAALRAVRQTVQPEAEEEEEKELLSRKKGSATEEVRGEGKKEVVLFMGFQTAAGAKVAVSETALAAVRGDRPPPSITSSTNKPSIDPSISSPLVAAGPSITSQSSATPRIRPQFRPLAMKPHPLSTSRPSVRYKPVFKRGQQATPTQTEAPPTATPTSTSLLQHSSSDGLFTTPEGVVCDRATSRRPLTPVQTFLGPDGTYMSTPIHRYRRRNITSAVRPQTTTASIEATREKEGEGGDGGGKGKEGKDIVAPISPVSVESATSTVRGEERERSSDCVQNEGEPLPEKGTDSVEEMGNDGGKEEMKDIQSVGERAVDQLDDSLDEDEPPPMEVPTRHHPRRRRRPVRRKVAPRMAGSLLIAHTELWERRLPLSARGPPGRFSHRQLYRAGVHPATLAVTAISASSYSFNGELFFSSAVLEGTPVCVGDGAMLRLNNRVAGSTEMWEAFASSPGVDRQLISYQWFKNHYRWVVWKLAAMETRYPRECGGRVLTPDWLMKQLRYRYDREIEGAERPALRRICERDDVSRRRMVLCVSGVYSCPYSRHPEEVEYPSIEVTDGWYSLPAVLDHPLQYMVQSGKLCIGTKIVTFGAELVGSPEACHPLEAPPTLCLRLSANSTRRARWFARLGYQDCPLSFPLPLPSLFPDGGLVGCTQAVIARVYPLIHMEKVKEGKNIFRSSRAEEQTARQRQDTRQKKIEAISTRIQRELEEEEPTRRDGLRVGRRRSRRLNTLQVKQLQDGESIHWALTNSSDPQALQEALSSVQVAMLQSYHQSQVERRQSELRRRVEEAVREEEERGSLPQQHTSTPLLRVRLVAPGPGAPLTDCQLSVWRPGEGVRGALVEGRLVKMWNLNTSNRKNRSGSLQLSATPRTKFEVVDIEQCDVGEILGGYRPRECVSIGRLVRGEGVWCGEFDTVGIVVMVISEQAENTSSGSSRKLDTVYMADGEGNMVAVRVWDGLKHHALQGLVTPSVLLSATSLSLRGPHPLSNHTLSATASDHTHFSQAPPLPNVREGLLLLETQLPSNKTDYLQSLEDEVMNIHLPLHHHH